MSETQDAPSFGGSTVEASEELVQALNGESAPVEAAPEEEAKPVEEAPKQDDKFAAKFAALTRKEKEIRAREAKVQQQLAELEARIKASEAAAQEVDKYKNLPERLKKEPLKVMEESGLTFEQLAQMVLNDGKPTQDMVLSEYERKINSKVEELEKKLQEKEAKEQQERQEQALQAFTAQLTDFVTNTPDYELIRANEAVDLVYQVIEDHYSETGEILANKDACDAVEEYLLEEAKKLIDRDKVKKLLQPQTATKAADSSGKSSPTLSNAQAAQAPKNTARFLSNEESLAQAAKLIRWED